MAEQVTASEKLDEIARPDRDSDGGTPERQGGLRIENDPNRGKNVPGLDTSREVPLWERDDAPDGSTESSLLVYENGVPVRVSGPTHYTHLANGQIVGGYGIGTHADMGDGPVPIVAHFSG